MSWIRPPREVKPSIWLALSGGGFRAALYHLGCLKRLRELNLLDAVGYVSATSGGSFAAALWLHCWNDTDKEKSWSEFEATLLATVRRGVLLPTTLLVCAYALYAVALVAALTGSPTIAATMGLGGAGAHIALVLLLLSDGAHKPFPVDRLSRGAKEARRRARVRLFRMLFVPHETRWRTLDVRAFEGFSLATLSKSDVQAYFTAIDIVTGSEYIFSRRIIARLTPSGCRELWDQQNDGDLLSANVPIAQMVAASMAVPPLFRPVAMIKDDEGKVGQFIDSGVIDNLACNVPLALSVHLREGAPSQTRSSYEVPFETAVGYMLGLDASATVDESVKARWPRLRTAFRLLDILQSHQIEHAMLVAEGFSQASVPSAFVGLRIGFIFDGTSKWFHDTVRRDLGEAIARTRTSLDSFTLTECAAIAFQGYSHIDTWYHDNAARLQRDFNAVPAPARTLAELFDPSIGRYDVDRPVVLRHMRSSSSQFAIVRTIRRMINR